MFSFDADFYFICSDCCPCECPEVILYDFSHLEHRQIQICVFLLCPFELPEVSLDDPYEPPKEAVFVFCF